MSHDEGRVSRLALIDELIRRSPKNPELYVVKARELLDASRADDAVVELNVAIAMDPANFPAWLARGEAHLQAGRYDQAVSDFSTALRFEPEDQRAAAGREMAIQHGGAAAPPENAPANDEGSADMDRNADAPRESRAAAPAPRTPSPDASQPAVATPSPPTLLYFRIRQHFGEIDLGDLIVLERSYPAALRPDLQLALESWTLQRVAALGETAHFCGKPYSHVGELLTPNPRHTTESMPAMYEDLAIAKRVSVRCLTGGCWLLTDDEMPYLLLLSLGERGTVTIQIAVPNTIDGKVLADELVAQFHLATHDKSMLKGATVTLGGNGRYEGCSSPFTLVAFDAPRVVSREGVILPEATLDTVESNVLGFLRVREGLIARGLPARKRMLLFGPPGTGKSQAIHYLLSAAPSEGDQLQTRFIMPPLEAELFPIYLDLARRFQPSILVMENIEVMAGQELMEILHQMRDVPSDTRIVFLLTASQPKEKVRTPTWAAGYIDQAIEIGLPNADCRARLVRRFAGDISDDLAHRIVDETEGSSGAFLEELVRRATQSRLSRTADGPVDADDLERAWHELHQNDDVGDIGFHAS